MVYPEFLPKAPIFFDTQLTPPISHSSDSSEKLSLLSYYPTIPPSGNLGPNASQVQELLLPHEDPAMLTPSRTQEIVNNFRSNIHAVKQYHKYSPIIAQVASIKQQLLNGELTVQAQPSPHSHPPPRQELDQQRDTTPSDIPEELLDLISSSQQYSEQFSDLLDPSLKIFPRRTLHQPQKQSEDEV